ncbi:Response regulator [Candidatus Burkholderia verschuerenii]|uniref:Response regulator n=1 Tax=Candidatus Burkholderia verschuerenii TaxID=242163 RepID=A0A0L0MCL8_9BURK|nr:Response regulator [Candidatus Burkholderia verschuerenii]
MRALDYQTAFHLAPVGLVLSRDRIIEDCNEQLCAIFGFDREALIGKSFQVLYPSPDEFARIGERIAAHISTQGTYSDDRIMKRSNGELFWCHVTGRALDRDVPHAAGVWTFEDLSATRRVAIELTPREREIAAQLVMGKTSKQIGQRRRLARRVVDPHDLGRAARVERAGIVRAIELEARLEAAASWLPDRHSADDIARIVQLPEKLHRCIDDHRALAFAIAARDADLLEPRDPHLLHVAEVHGVVDVPERVHVAPADRHGQIEYGMKRCVVSH